MKKLLALFLGLLSCAEEVTETNLSLSPPPILQSQVLGLSGLDTRIVLQDTILARYPNELGLFATYPQGHLSHNTWSYTGPPTLIPVTITSNGNPIGNATVRVLPRERREIRLLLIGDSLLTKTATIANTLAYILPRPWKMLGTHEPPGALPGVRVEAAGGRKWSDYNRPESLLYDVEQYLLLVGDRPNVIIVLLGINDCFGVNPESPTLVDRCGNTMIDQAESLLMRLSTTGARIGVGLVPVGSSSEDAFFASYAGRFTSWGWQRIQRRLVELELARLPPAILLPTNLALHPDRDFPPDNAIHPTSKGLSHIATALAPVIGEGF